ncbi:MAG TPA: hypothetical protein VIF57_03520 [Polyangia bacterium]
MPNQDISRWLLQTRKHYAAARLQQGRVLLDSDANDGGNLGAEVRRRALVDVFGPKGSRDEGFTLRRPLDGTGAEPAPLRKGDVIQSLPVSFNHAAPVDVLPLGIGSGSLMLGGMRFDMDQAESVVFQRDFLQATAGPGGIPEFAPAFRQLYYLRAFEQGVSSVDDQEINEAMLRGPDSSFRIRRMRRVEVFDGFLEEATTCNQAFAALVDDLEDLGNATFDERTSELVSNGRLQLVFKGGEAADACAPPDPFGKRYLGAENQTLRVLLTHAATYVWALDNGAPLFKVRVDGLTDPSVNGVKVTILNPPRDERSMPFKNRVVEIVPFGALLDGGDLPFDGDPQLRKVADQLGVFTRAASAYDPVAHTFTLEAPDPSPVLDALRLLVYTWDDANPFAGELNVPTGGRDERFFYMRLWHDAPTADDVELESSTDPDGAPLGDTGLVPVFANDGQRGDFWVATLRVDVPDRIQPFDLLKVGGVPPTGPRVFFAPLALIAGEAVDGAPDSTRITEVQDCRPRIRPLTDRGCTTFIVGDGLHSFGDFTTIQEALAALPPEGGVISVRPGVYKGPITITGHDITLEGCGDATVIDHGTDNALTGLVYITRATNVRVTGFKVQAADERALMIDLVSQGIEISGMHFVSGRIENGVYQLDGSPDFAQVQITGNSSDISLRDSLLEPNRQACVRIADASRVTMSGLDLVGSPSLLDRDNAPLVWMDAGATDIALSDSTLDTRGQQGVHVSFGAQRIELDRLSIAIHVQEGSANGGPITRVAPARPGVNIDALQIDSSVEVAARLRRSRIVSDGTATEHAAVVVGGFGVTIEDNEIVTPAPPTIGRPIAWGGVQVLSSSQKIRIVGNRIQGGYGHGITLGSVIWFNENVGSLLGFQRQGAGAGQTVQSATSGGNVVTGSVAQIELPPHSGIDYFPTGLDLNIFDLVIADNRITDMSTNGISAITVLGVPDGTLPEIASVRIQRNAITGNLNQLFDQVFTFQALPLSAAANLSRIEIPMLPFGGIVLATAIDTQIRDNDISGNGITDVLPVNGIFVLIGDAIEIDGNGISTNGARAPADTSTVVHAGPRAGIAVMLAGTESASSVGQVFDLLNNATPLDSTGFSLRITNNTVRQPEGRALEVLATGPVHIQGNYLMSEGNAGGDAPSEQLQVGDLVYVQNLGAPWEQTGLSRQDGRLANFNVVDLTLETLIKEHPALSPYRYVSTGGPILFNNNHTVLDWDVTRPPTQADAPLAFFPVALLTLDHLEMLGNHLALRVEGVPAGLPPPITGLPAPVTEPILAHLLALGVTVKIELNRFSENLRSVFLSVMARAEIMNNTAFNQCTHEIFAIRQVKEQHPAFSPSTNSPTNSIQKVNNQILFVPVPPLNLDDPDDPTSLGLRSNLIHLFGLLFPIGAS